ncbi:MAG: hypothetical protein M3Q55_14515 [Acidobacteriota bacterium]|nr:hypothetical protein [Acidobacteriota bacterium]
MLALTETFREQMSPLRATLYFDALSALSIEQVEHAVRLAVKSKTFFPKPTELIELVSGSDTEQASEAWTAFCQEVSRVGYTGSPKLPEATLETVRVLFGNWKAACSSLPSLNGDRGPELQGWRKQFIASYADTKRRQALGELNAAPSLSGLIADIRAWEQKRTKEIA